MNVRQFIGSGVAVLVGGAFMVALIAAGPDKHGDHKGHDHKDKDHDKCPYHDKGQHKGGEKKACDLKKACGLKGAQFNDDGELLLPKNYRKWVFVGAPVTPNDMNDGKAAFPEFHNVYIDHASYKAYSKTGQFPEGTTLIKELVTVGAKKAASGNGYFQGEFIGVEAAVKSAKQFPDEPGNWAYFSFGKFPDLADSAKAHPAASCNACHQAVAEEDWVFTQYYPVLRDAKPGDSEDAGQPAK